MPSARRMNVSFVRSFVRSFAVKVFRCNSIDLRFLNIFIQSCFHSEWYSLFLCEIVQENIVGVPETRRFESEDQNEAGFYILSSSK